MKSVIKQVSLHDAWLSLFFLARFFFLAVASGHLSTSDVSLLGQVYLDQLFSRVCLEHQSFHDWLIHKDGPSVSPLYMYVKLVSPPRLR